MPATISSPFSFALAGAGTVGTAVALTLKEAGHMPVAVASRTAASADRSAALLDTIVSSIDGLPEADVVLIGATDLTIAEVCEQIAWRAGSVAWHFAGSFGLDVLSPALGAGALGAALHPVQSCPTVVAARLRLPGSAWGVTCSAELEDWALDLISTDLRGDPVVVQEEDRPAWHAASVVTANGVLALLSAAERILNSIGIEDALRILGPLAAGAVANARTEGGGAVALTGPVIRGEVESIARHLAALEETGADGPYRSATHLIVEAAVTAGRIDEPLVGKLLRLLGEDR